VFTISEDLKERFGKLGIYLIEKAQDNLKDINRHNLFQKAEIKKKNTERVNEHTLKYRNQLIESYNQILNNALSNILLELKEKVLSLKNKLVDDLIASIISQIKEEITKNYSKYVEFLLDQIKNNSNFVGKASNVVLILNSRDYNSLVKKPNKIKKFFNSNFEFKESEDDFIGGFKTISIDGTILYDYSFDILIEKKKDIIQKEFSKIISDANIKELGIKFENYIQNKKLEIDGILKNYDRI